MGQITAGFLEYCKGRSFPCTVYLCLGFYCLTHYAYYCIPPHFEINFNTSIYYTYDEDSLVVFYAGWTFIAFALLLGSVKSNLLFILQLLATFAFFLLRAFGEGTGIKRNAGGILESIAGFFSLLVAISQILNNETCFRMCCPSCPINADNEIDMLPPYLMYPNGVLPLNRVPIDTQVPYVPTGAVVEKPVVVV